MPEGQWPPRPGYYAEQAEESLNMAARTSAMNRSVSLKSYNDDAIAYAILEVAAAIERGKG